MAAETLLTAARRVVRFMRIDLNKGGIVAIETQKAIETLDKMVLAETEAEKRREESLALATAGAGDL